MTASVSWSTYSKRFEASELLVHLRVHGEREVLASETPEPATQKYYLPFFMFPRGMFRKINNHLYHYWVFTFLLIDD